MNWFDAFVILGTVYFACGILDWFENTYYTLSIWWRDRQHDRECEDCNEEEWK